MDALHATRNMERPTQGSFECDLERVEPKPARTRLRAGLAIGVGIVVLSAGALGSGFPEPGAPSLCPAAYPSATTEDTPARAAVPREVDVLLPRDGDVILGPKVPFAAIVSLGRSLADSREAWVLVTVRADGVVLGSAEIPVTSSIVVGTLTIQPPARGKIAELTMSRRGSTVRSGTVRIVVAGP